MGLRSGTRPILDGGKHQILKKGEAGMTKELMQMHDMNVLCHIKRDSLTKEEQAKVLAFLICLKEKLDMAIKARMCVDG
jgi:hypothetical protein